MPNVARGDTIGESINSISNSIYVVRYIFYVYKVICVQILVFGEKIWRVTGGSNNGAWEIEKVVDVKRGIVCELNCKTGLVCVLHDGTMM